MKRAKKHNKAKRERVVYMPAASDTNTDEVVKMVSEKAGMVLLETLYRAEDYMAAANIIIFLYAIARTKDVGRLKTVQRNYNNILASYNEASAYVDKVGIRQAYEDLKDAYGVELAFDDFDLNEVFDDTEMYERIRLRVNESE